jgi:hypothetical protein
MNVAYTVAFPTPFQFGIQGVQCGIQDIQYGQDGQLHNIKIQGISRGSVVSAVSTDARDATIGVSVRIKRLKQDVLGSNPWRACLNETNLLLQLLLQCGVHF